MDPLYTDLCQLINNRRKQPNINDSLDLSTVSSSYVRNGPGGFFLDVGSGMLQQIVKDGKSRGVYYNLKLRGGSELCSSEYKIIKELKIIYGYWTARGRKINKIT